MCIMIIGCQEFHPYNQYFSGFNYRLCINVNTIALQKIKSKHLDCSYTSITTTSVHWSTHIWDIWASFCTVGGRGDASSIFIYSLWFQQTQNKLCKCYLSQTQMHFCVSQCSLDDELQSLMTTCFIQCMEKEILSKRTSSPKGMELYWLGPMVNSEVHPPVFFMTSHYN